jgi:hypothetical protein
MTLVCNLQEIRKILPKSQHAQCEWVRLPKQQIQHAQFRKKLEEVTR